MNTIDTDLNNSVAIAIPIYEPHFHFGKQLLLSRRDTHNEHIALHFGCSTKDEADKLQSFCKDKSCNNVHTCVIECEHIGNKALYKKHTLLQMLVHSFSYIACFDCEVVFVKHIPAIVLIDRAVNPIMLGNSISSLINERCLSAFGDKALCAGSWKDVYFWFSDVPVYCSLSLTKFYAHFSNTSKLCECYEHFEHILYIYFLKLCTDVDVSIVDIGEVYGIHNGWSLEGCSSQILEALVTQGAPMPLWCSSEAYLGTSHRVRSSMYLLCHVDRSQP